MELLQVKIENFGKLSDASFDFSSGANVICQENGWGKSTLAAFIRIMFFGFENAGKQDKLINERKRFLPWQGGVYGGSIRFEAEGKEYVMRRVFGRKEKDDEFELREAKTNLPSEAYTTNIGEELFEIDAASFRRTVFISQQDCEAGSTDGIHAKLGNLVENTDDINNFQAVYDRLKDKTNKMVPTRKTGSLNREKTALAEMENALREEEGIARSIREVEALREIQVGNEKKLDEEIREGREKQAKLSAGLDLKVKRKEYRGLQAACEESAEKLSDCKQEFPYSGRIPSPQQMEQWQELDRQCERYHDILLENRLSSDEWASFEQIEKLLGGQIPSEEDMDRLAEAQKEYDGLKLHLLSGRLTPEEEGEWEGLETKYSKGIPTQEEIQHIRDIWDDVQRRKENFTSQKATLDTLRQIQDRKKATSNPFALVLAVIIAVAGLFAGIWLHSAVGVALAAVLLAAVVLNGIRRKKSRSASGSEVGHADDAVASLQHKLEADEEAVLQGTKQVRDFLDSYEIFCEEEQIRSCLGNLAVDAGKYYGLAARKKNVDDETKARYETLKTSLSGFMKLYYENDIPEEQWAFMLSALKEQVCNFWRWEPKVKAYETAKINYQNSRRLLEQKLQEYGFVIQDSVSMQLQDIRDQVHRHEQAQEAYDTALQRKMDFVQENDIAKLKEVAEPETGESLSEIQEVLEQCLEEKEKIRKNIAGYDNQLQDLEEKLDELKALKVEWEERKEQYNKGKKKYDLLLKTMELLQRAKDNLTARYMGPVQAGFEKYFSMISGQDAGEYRFDASANLTVQELGMPREIRFLSDGCKDLAGICTRMALVDAMYEGEKPFVIFDDPFVNLDDGKTERALVFLREISREYQVIYFTCNVSRVGADNE